MEDVSEEMADSIVEVSDAGEELYDGKVEMVKMNEIMNNGYLLIVISQWYRKGRKEVWVLDSH